MEHGGLSAYHVGRQVSCLQANKLHIHGGVARARHVSDERRSCHEGGLTPKQEARSAHIRARKANVGRLLGGDLIVWMWPWAG